MIEDLLSASASEGYILSYLTQRTERGYPWNPDGQWEAQLSKYCADGRMLRETGRGASAIEALATALAAIRGEILKPRSMQAIVGTYKPKLNGAQLLGKLGL